MEQKKKSKWIILCWTAGQEQGDRQQELNTGEKEGDTEGVVQ